MTAKPTNAPQPGSGFGLAPKSAGALRDRFLQPPFGELNQRLKEWKDQKRKWLALGIQSEQGRDDALTFRLPTGDMNDGRRGGRCESKTSIFDPVLCELAYTWWAPSGGVIGDPFAGGSVRGLVASILGYRYAGIELRPEQVAANYAQIDIARGAGGRYPPVWRCGDAGVLAPTLPPLDFVFTCPPYGDLERYSEDPADLSTMPYEAFLTAYRAILGACVARLKPNRFACVVVSNYRDRQTGLVRRLTDHTCDAMEDAGAPLYTYARILNNFGTAPMRAAPTFVQGRRKLVNTTQDLLVFIKGDPTAADAAISGIDDVTPTM